MSEKKDVKRVIIEMWREGDNKVYHSITQENCNWIELYGILSIALLKARHQTVIVFEEEMKNE